MKLLTALVLTAHFVWLNAETGGGGSTFLTSLGTVEGKSYFYDQSTLRNWTTSKMYCEEFGMKLATIKTEIQLQFLKSHYNSSTGGFYNPYWVALRDSRLPRALSWDDTETEVENFNSISWSDHIGTAYQVCGLYRSAATSTLEMWKCGVLVYTLCET